MQSKAHVLNFNLEAYNTLTASRSCQPFFEAKLLHTNVLNCDHSVKAIYNIIQSWGN